MAYPPLLTHTLDKNNDYENSPHTAIDLYVVGNRFRDFSDNKTVLTVDQFCELVKSTLHTRQEKNYLLHAGQGLTDQDDQTITKLIRMNNLKDQFICADSLFPTQRAAKYMTHKHLDKNTVISEPTKLSETSYESYLMIDENCAEVSDHLTGQHIQGAVLMEAARQMTLAVTEKYFIDNEYRNQISFISNSVQTKFHAYAFPLAIKIHYEIKKRRGLEKKNSQFIVLVTFLQNDEPVSEVTYDFSVMNKFYIYHKEKEAAKSVIWKAITKGVWNEKSYALA